MTGKRGEIDVAVRYLPHYDGLPPIRRMTDGASGWDIQAACAEAMPIEPGRAILVPAGFQLAVPPGYEAQVRPRSGLALRNRIGVLNSPGTIDSDYRGEVSVILFNFGDERFVVERGDRVAQLVVCALPRIRLVEQSELGSTDRGPGGFGHTG